MTTRAKLQRESHEKRKRALKETLYREVEVKNALTVEGINVDPQIFRSLELGSRYQEQIHTGFEMDHEHHVGIEFPVGFYTPSDFRVAFRWDRRSRYSLQNENGKFYVTEDGHELFPVEFLERPKYYDLQTFDGTPMSRVATYQRQGALIVVYSNECSLKQESRDCLYCNINATKDAYGEAQGVFWKHPKQIGETAAAAYKDGARHITITGGFIPERREVDYYVDVAEAIKEHTGLKDFNGTGVIGAPLDLSVIEKYKEVGYRTIAMNIEIWDKNIFKSICPGKVTHCGGWDHWVKALERAVEVFGWGRVRSNMVAGIEPKQSTLEGVEYLTSRGVIAYAGAWCPNPGSALEGHHTPEPAWHFDMAKKVTAFLRGAGFSYEQLYDASAGPDGLWHDFYRIEDELLPIFSKEAETSSSQDGVVAHKSKEASQVTA